MKIVRVEPGKPAVAAEIDGSLKSMQAVVRGLIEILPMYDGDVILVCNEEGKLLNLPPNRPVYLPGEDKPYDVIYGTFFLCRVNEDGDMLSLSDEEVARYLKKYA